MNFHKIASLFLLGTHSLFLIRSALLLKSGKAPLKTDRILMFLSQILLPVVMISGIIGLGGANPLHAVAGFMPLAMMFVLSRKSWRRKRPLFLPLANGIWLLIALLTGLYLH